MGTVDYGCISLQAAVGEPEHDKDDRHKYDDPHRGAKGILQDGAKLFVAGRYGHVHASLPGQLSASAKSCY